MRGVCRDVERRLASLLVALLILLPLLASGHYHRADQARTADSCPLCMVKFDSPAVTAPPVPQLSSALYGFALSPGSTAKPGFSYRPFKAGRAPPLHAPIHAA